MKRKVLFLCTGNSCRSQTAEGLVNHFLGDSWEAFSAGTQPAGYVHPLAMEAMAELGIDLSGHESKSADQYRSVEMDLVLTVCDDAGENCPVWLGQGRRVHMSFRDPAAVAGSHEERLAIFRQVRDEIRQQVLAYLAQDQASPASIRPRNGIRTGLGEQSGPAGNESSHSLRMRYRSWQARLKRS